MPGPPRAGRVSRGDAEAVFQAGAGAGRLLRRNDIVKFGTPGDLDIRASIRPFSGGAFDGRHYCAEDWHVILIAFIAGGDKSFTQQQAADELNRLVVTLTLDGAELPTSRTSVRRALDPESLADPPEPTVEEAYFVQWGKLMSPSDLSVGSHSLSYTKVDPLNPQENEQDSMTFFIDAPGTGACLT
jgi:hypothetical protein